MFVALAVRYVAKPAFRASIIGITLSLGLVAIMVAWSGRLVFLGNGGQESVIDRSPVREIIIFLMMSLGIAARVLSKAIEERKKASASETLKGVLAVDRWDFLYPFLMSFMTFGVIYQQLSGSVVSIASMTLAFQNGFFWQTVIKAR